MRPVTVDGDVLILQRLDDEVRHNAPVITTHARSVSVEDAANLDIYAKTAVIIEKQRLCAALSFVIAGPWTDRVDVAEIGFRLRIDMGVAINFRCRGLDDRCAGTTRQFQDIQRADHVGEQSAHWVALVVGWRCRRCKIEDD
ncbi:hypothetical protein D3C80_1560260 [compost metagenome]